MESVTSNRVRPLSLDDLGISTSATFGATRLAETMLEPLLPEHDEVLTKVRAALGMGFTGVILSGPPGTGKSWYAIRIADVLASDQNAITVLQFHTSYQYEDFMEGFVPKDGGGFELQKKSFALLCEAAIERPDVLHVLLIDEISRCDVARVFGEALTYLEMDKRNREFTLSSGSVMKVPENLIIIATMNPWDKGVDELDIALERRFAIINMPPSSDALEAILVEQHADASHVERVVGFFKGVQKLDDEMVHLGHAYFRTCVDEQSARLTWEFQLFPFFKKACRLDKETLQKIVTMWKRAFPDVNAEGAAPPSEAEEAATQASTGPDAATSN